MRADGCPAAIHVPKPTRSPEPHLPHGKDSCLQQGTLGATESTGPHQPLVLRDRHIVERSLNCDPGHSANTQSRPGPRSHPEFTRPPSLLCHWGQDGPQLCSIQAKCETSDLTAQIKQSLRGLTVDMLGSQMSVLFREVLKP